MAILICATCVKVMATHELVTDEKGGHLNHECIECDAKREGVDPKTHNPHTATSVFHTPTDHTPGKE